MELEQPVKGWTQHLSLTTGEELEVGARFCVENKQEWKNSHLWCLKRRQ